MCVFVCVRVRVRVCFSVPLFCCLVPGVFYCLAVILLRKRELIALLCVVAFYVLCLFRRVPRLGLWSMRWHCMVIRIGFMLPNAEF